MRPIVFVLLDGLRLDTACACMGYVQAAAGQPLAVTAELPSLSRPLYETLMTGQTPIQSGITGNGSVRRSRHPSVFDRCRGAGQTTAAAAYHWFSELYNHAPFDPAQRVTHDPDAAIQHGMFYWQDGYPDDHLFADAMALWHRHSPHFLLVHSMGVDDAGHRYGGGGTEYRRAARQADALLSRTVPVWLDAGCTVIVTSDHGMGDDGMHGGPGATETQVPFWLLGTGRMAPGTVLRQTEIAGTVCALLGVSTDGMAVNAEISSLRAPLGARQSRGDGRDCGSWIASPSGSQ